jgi:hypothetical protein
MMRQLISRGIVLAALVAGSTGCETFHSMVRKNDDDATPKAVDSDVSKVTSADSTDKDPKPFFNTTRNRSAFSSFSPEAQQIEKDLSVY